MIIIFLIMQGNKETKEERDDVDFFKDTHYDKVEGKWLIEETHLKYVSLLLYVIDFVI